MHSTWWGRSAGLLLSVVMLGPATGFPGQPARPTESRAAADKPAVDTPRNAANGKTDQFGDPLPAGALARMGTVRWRHSGSISFVGYTGQGKQLLTGCSDGFFRIWDITTGKEIRRFSMGTAGNLPRGGIANAAGGVYFVGNTGRITISTDGATLAIMGTDGLARIWDVASGKEVRTIGTKPAVNTPRQMIYGSANLALSSDGESLATQSNDRVIRLWEVSSGKEIRQIGKPAPDKQPLNAVRFLVARGGGNSLVFSPDGNTLGAVDSQLDAMNMPVTTIRLYDVKDGKELRSIKPPQQNNFLTGGLVFAPDSKSMGWSGSGTIEFYEVSSGNKLWTHNLGQPNYVAQEMVFAPGGKILAVRASNRPGIQLWDAVSGKELRRVGENATGNAAAFGFVVRGRFGGGGPQLVAFSPDGKVLAEGTSGGAIRLWDVANGKEILHAAAGHHTGVSTLAIASDGKTLTTYAGSRTLIQWEVSTGKEVRRVQLPASTNIALAANGKTAACSVAADRIEIWDIAAGRTIRTIQVPAPQQRVFGIGGGLALSADGSIVAVNGFDQVTRVFDAATGKDLATLSDAQNDTNPNAAFLISRAMYLGGISPVLSRDGKAVAVAGGGMPGGVAGGGFVAPGQAGGSAIRVWNVARGRKPRHFDAEKTAVTAMTFSPDGRIIATGNGDGSISLWEALTGKECLRTKATADAQPAPAASGIVFAVRAVGSARAAIGSIAISDDGRTLAAGGSDRNVRLWDLRTGDELGTFTGHTSAVLSVAFAPDNRTVISSSADTTALVWDGSRLIKPRQSAEVKAEEISPLWQDLAADPMKAFKAVTSLSAAPRQAVELLKQHMKPAPGVDPAHLAQLAADLDSKDFKVRQRATAALEKLGELAEPGLRKALEKDASLETRRRVERLLELIVNDQTPPADVQRALRGVWILEQLATPEARHLLQTLAAGAPGDRLTRDARDALKRLGG